MNWLWDTKITIEEARSILKDEHNPRFPTIAEKLISRVSPPREVFILLDKEAFCRHWMQIKKRMKKDAWLQDKVSFWQAVYEQVFAELKEQGITFRKHRAPSSGIKKEVARQIRTLRIKKGLTQKQVAQKLGVIQPYISRIENGYENMSLEILEKISRVLKAHVSVKLQ